MIPALLPDGRLHLQHGPIDLLCRAWGSPAEVQAAYAQAAATFPGLLPGLCKELPLLREPVIPGLDPGIHRAESAALAGPGPRVKPGNDIVQAMIAACRPYAAGFITPMAAVAGAVADHVLAAMLAGRRLERAFVNNGGDIAFHLAPGQVLRAGLVAELAAPALDGVFTLRADHPARGIATSGRACKGQGGRSFSFGIADAVTVLARTAAMADAAATVIGNAVDLPGHPDVQRRPASAIDPDSDLRDRLITWAVGTLGPAETDAALDAGRVVADALLRRGLIEGAVLALRGRLAVCLPLLEAA